MDCQVIKVEQGTDEWDALRRCRITASRVGDVMSKPVQKKDENGTKLFDKDGKPIMVRTKRFQEYRQQKILELLGHVAAEESPEWYQHGREQEPIALQRYEFKYGVETDHDVFLIHKEHQWLSCSPDALEIENGEYVRGNELKCRKLYKNYREAIQRVKKYADTDRKKCIDPGYRWQVQTSMLITGWDQWLYTNYYQNPDNPAEWRMGRVPIPRDQKLIDQIEITCMEFMLDCYEAAGLTMQ